MRIGSDTRLNLANSVQCAVPGEFQRLQSQHDISESRAGLIDVVSSECNGHFRGQLTLLSLKIEQV